MPKYVQPDVVPQLTAADVHRLVDLDDPIILEIGANDGTDTMALAREFPQGFIHSFECDPRPIAKWKERMLCQHNAVLRECAVSDRTGTSLFYPSGGDCPEPEKYGAEPWDKSGSVLPPDKHVAYVPWLKFLEPIHVQTLALDDWGDPPVIDFAWVDVQGAEAMVLRGAQRLVPRIRWWYCECHRFPYYQGQATMDEIVSLLPGFELQSKHEYDNFLFRNTRS